MAIQTGRSKLLLPGLLPARPLPRTLPRPPGRGDGRRAPTGRSLHGDRQRRRAAGGGDRALARRCRCRRTRSAPAPTHPPPSCEDSSRPRPRGRTRSSTELAGRGLEPSDANAALLFGEWSPPGSSQAFPADRPIVVAVGAPAGRIVDGAPPPSDLIVEVRRSRSADPRRGRAAAAAGRAAARLPRRPFHGLQLRGEGRRVHPDHRRRGPAVLRLPGVPPPASSRTDSSAGWTPPSPAR